MLINLIIYTNIINFSFFSRKNGHRGRMLQFKTYNFKIYIPHKKYHNCKCFVCLLIYFYNIIVVLLN